MNIPFFNPRKINKDSSTSILRGIQSLMPLGYSILQSLYIQIDIEEGKNKKVIEQAVNLVSKKNVDLEKALLQQLKHSHLEVLQNHQLPLNYEQD